MPELLSLPMPARVAPLRRLWADLGGQAKSRPIAIYGAGEHTRTLLNCVLSEADGPSVRFILDDAPAGTREIAGIPVRLPHHARQSEVALVLVSSDSLEDVLARRAHEWVGTADVPVVRIYGEGKTRPATHRYPSVWGWAREERNAHLPMSPSSLVLRLPRSPEPTRATALPLPPPELRAGYDANNDAAYLASGQRDVAAMRDLIRRHAPQSPPSAACSTGDAPPDA